MIDCAHSVDSCAVEHLVPASEVMSLVSVDAVFGVPFVAAGSPRHIWNISRHVNFTVHCPFRQRKSVSAFNTYNDYSVLAHMAFAVFSN